MLSGYTDCACRDCFEITISNDTSKPEMCDACKEAGCEPDKECCAPGAYGCADEDESVEGGETMKPQETGRNVCDIVPPNPDYEKALAHLDELIRQSRAAKLASRTLADKVRFDRAWRAATKARSTIRPFVFDFEDAQRLAGEKP